MSEWQDLLTTLSSLCSFARVPERMKINTDESSESENETDEDEDEDDEGGLSDESANECLKRLDAENKDKQRTQGQGHKGTKPPGQKSDQPGVSLIDLEEQLAEECELEEARRRKKKKHR